MSREGVAKGVLLALVVCISALFLTMIRQFLMALFMAALFAALFSPAHRWLTRLLGGRRYIASILVVAASVCLVLGPLGLMVGVVIGQAITVSQSVTPWVQSFLAEPDAFTVYLEGFPYYQQILPYRDLIVEKAGQAVAGTSSLFIDGLSSATKLTVNAVFGSLVMLYAMFHFLTMGEVLLRKILYFLPLDNNDAQQLLLRFTSVTRATLKGTMIIGILQGGICGFAFYLAGIQGPVFWATVMAVLSIIPAVGTALVWVPALIILALQKQFIGAAILAVLCGLVAGPLDNLLRPRLVGRDTQMHDLFVLFGTLGGISMFGILGLIIGPIIAALFITIWELYGKAFAAYLTEVGPLFSIDKGAGNAAPVSSARMTEEQVATAKFNDRKGESAVETSCSSQDDVETEEKQIAP
ncbi:AI-2E family transporter [Desulfobulbus alkaliphilus]|uniref:AI-2E family transporter n=1 Tax=Desulfobulbus alkaliphilus TaxID=869814 RepID=UPI001965C6F7|nr:AI-2E family transporter [Desulfobulbus alkaliphilus]MBM9538053.1 AI-2E family transporter [Desulfobulbus alkaliphilus]